MGTRKIVLSGYAYWAKVFEENRDLTGFEDSLKDSGGQCTIDMDIESSEMERLQKAGTMLKGRASPDNEGYTRVRFKRKWTEKFAGGAPIVQKEDGLPWSFLEDGNIGNGSTAKVILSVYDTTRKGIVGTRLEGVKVLVHLAYVPDYGFGDEEEAPPPPKATAPNVVPKKVAVLEDDEIPF